MPLAPSRWGTENEPKRPSPVRAAIIAAAAASPTAIPRVFGDPSGIGASEAAYWVSSVACCAGTRCTSRRYAAAAAAASIESDDVASRDEIRYPPCPPSIALTAS
jgi:hypothetical protein